MQANTQATNDNYRDELRSYIDYCNTVVMPRLEREFVAGDLESLHELEQLEQQVAKYAAELAQG